MSLHDVVLEVSLLLCLLAKHELPIVDGGSTHESKRLGSWGIDRCKCLFGSLPSPNGAHTSQKRVDRDHLVDCVLESHFLYSVILVDIALSFLRNFVFVINFELL